MLGWRGWTRRICLTVCRILLHCRLPMANHASAEKRNRQRITRTARNRAITSAVRTHVKRVHAALEAKDKAKAKDALKVATVALDKAASKGAVHPKAASRTISRLSAQVNKLA